MSTEPQFATDSLYIERDVDRKIRYRNKLYYRFNHWPIWIFVFFIAPGPLTFDLFERGFDSRLLIWLGVVLIGTAIAGLREAGDTVVRVLPGHESEVDEFHCDRELARVGGRWVVRPL